MSTSGLIIKNTTFLYVKMIVTTIISLYTARVFLNTLGASDYGLYTLISGVIFMFGFLQGMLTRATLRYLCYYKSNNDIENQRKVFSISMILHCALSVVLLFGLLMAANFLFSGFLKIDEDRISVATWVYYLMIGSLVFTVMSTPYDSVLNANENMFYYSVIGILESVLKLILAISLPYIYIDRLLFFSISISLITILSLIIKGVYCHIRYRECKLSFILYEGKMAKEMTSYAGWNLLTLVTYVISMNAMPVILNVFFGTIINAAQGVASQVNGVLSSFSTNILKALNPTINKTGGANDLNKMMKYGLTGSKMSFLVLCFFSVPVIIECPYIFKLWLINVPEWTVTFCVLLLLMTLVNQLSSVFCDCIYASLEIKNYCIIKSVLNVAPLMLVYLLFRLGCAPYMAYVALFVFWSILGGVVIIYYNMKLYNLDLISYCRQLLFPCLFILIIELLSGMLTNIIMEESLQRLILNFILASVEIVLLSWYYVLDKVEKELLCGFAIVFNNKVLKMLNKLWEK